MKISRKTVKEAIGNIQKLSDREDLEEVRAIYGAGSYDRKMLAGNSTMPRE